MSSSAYSASEYDAFVVGEWRPVRSYCPRRHRWVLDYAAPIVAATVTTVSDPDAAMQSERLPGETNRYINLVRFHNHRRAEYEAELIRIIEDIDKPILADEAAAWLGVSRATVDRLCAWSDKLQLLQRKNLGTHVGLLHHTRRDLPLSANEQRLVEVMTELGEAIWQEISDRMGWKSKNRITAYKHMLDWRVERVTDAHRAYDRRVYRLKSKYLEA